jgi:hypothetical protein
MMRVFLVFLVLLVGGAYYLFDQWLAPQLRGPVRVGEVLKSVREEKSDATKQSFAVTQASIVQETDKRVVIRFSYKGKDPNWRLNACGDVSENNMSGPWGCEPRVLIDNAANTDGTGAVEIGFVLANSSMAKGRERECSDTVGISVYGQDGSVFYRNTYTLKKVWHLEPSMWSWYRYRHEGCPVRSAS